MFIQVVRRGKIAFSSILRWNKGFYARIFAA